MPTRKVTKPARSRRAAAAKKKPAAKKKRAVGRKAANRASATAAKAARKKPATKKAAANAAPARKRAAKATRARGVIGRVVDTVRDAVTGAIAAVTPAASTPEHPTGREKPSPDVS